MHNRQRGKVTNYLQEIRMEIGDFPSLVDALKEQKPDLSKESDKPTKLKIYGLYM